MYFKFMYLNDYNLRPAYTKMKFTKLFPNILINTKELDYYIINKYHECWDN